MPFKDRFRKAIGRDGDKSDNASISSASTGKNTNGTVTPTEGTSPLTTTKTAIDDLPPSIKITKTHSRLSKTLTWNSSSSSGDKKSKQELQKEKKLKQWAKSDNVEWTSPMDRRPGKKDQQCQNMLRAFELNKGGFGDRQMSICSGISPSGSRANSIGELLLSCYYKNHIC